MDAIMTNHDSFGHDPFERDLRTGLAAERAPDQLYRRIAQIPLDHPRAARIGLWQRLFGRPFSAEAMSWTGGLAAAAASLAIGFWLGFAGLAADESAGDDALVAIVFGDVSQNLGDEL
jgi:hypothetical protein